MYVTIYAESLNNWSTGKTSRVWADPSGITFSANVEDAALVIQAQCTDNRNSGDRGGDYNPVTRRLQIQLKNEDLVALIVAAKVSPDFATAQEALLGKEMEKMISERNAAVAERDRLRELLERFQQVSDDCAHYFSRSKHLAVEFKGRSGLTYC